MGLRLDGFKDLSKKDSLTGKKLNNIEYTLAPELTWKSSEFATFKLGPSYTIAREEGRTIEKDMRLNIQWVFILGSHPAHNF